MTTTPLIMKLELVEAEQPITIPITNRIYLDSKMLLLSPEFACICMLLVMPVDNVAMLQW